MGFISQQGNLGPRYILPFTCWSNFPSNANFMQNKFTKAKTLHKGDSLENSTWYVGFAVGNPKVVIQSLFQESKESGEKASRQSQKARAPPHKKPNGLSDPALAKLKAEAKKIPRPSGVLAGNFWLRNQSINSCSALRSAVQLVKTLWSWAWLDLPLWVDMLFVNEAVCRSCRSCRQSWDWNLRICCSGCSFDTNLWTRSECRFMC